MVDVTQAKEKILAHNRVNQYVDITPYELQVGFPIVNYAGFFPQPHELIIYVVPASIFKDKEQVVGYTGKSTGASFRVAKGVTVRTGGSGGRAVRDTVRKHSLGDLIITNQRVVFIGKDDNFDFPINKITAIKPLSKETFVIQAGRSSKNIFVEPGAVLYAAGFVNYAITCYNEGLDVNAEKKQAEDEMTDEQRNLCDQIKQEILATPQQKPKPQKKKWGCFTKFMFGVMCFFIAILIGVIIWSVKTNSPNKRLDSKGNLVEIQQYTDKELICKDGHPLIYGSIDEAKDFYADVDKDKVKILTSKEHSTIMKKQKTVTDDETLIYFIEESTNKEFIGEIQINLFSSDLTVDMNIEKAVELLTNYLPSDFSEYYKQDSCYKYKQGNVDIYTYSCRLNDSGIEYHNNGHNEISNYYHLTFINYKDTNQWKLETGYAAYGGKDLGWIEKYAESWNINIDKYIKN